MIGQQDPSGEFRSPGGFVFGVQGWNWGDQRPTSITFFLNGRAEVRDQHGRPIRGTVKDGRPVYFELSTHAQVLAALTEERIDWQTLACAGWPQLPYEALKGVKALGPTPASELKKIPDVALRRDALRMRAELDEAVERELQATADE